MRGLEFTSRSPCLAGLIYRVDIPHGAYDRWNNMAYWVHESNSGHLLPMTARLGGDKLCQVWVGDLWTVVRSHLRCCSNVKCLHPAFCIWSGTEMVVSTCVLAKAKRSSVCYFSKTKKSFDCHLMLCVPVCKDKKGFEHRPEMSWHMTYI